MRKLSYTKEDYIQIVQNRAKELNRIPRQEDFGRKHNLPSSSAITRNLGFKTWNEVLKLCEVGQTKQRYYNEKEALDNLKEYIEELGRVPTKREYFESKRQPSANWFANRFGSFENALNKIGYNGILTNDELLNILREFAINNRKSPSTSDMRNYKGLPSTQIYYDRFDTLSWNKILQLAGLELNNFIGYTKEFALEQLKKYYNEFDKIPTKDEYRKSNWVPEHSWYCKHFGSFKQACFEAGLIDKIYTNEERIEISIDELIKLGNELNRCPTVFEYEQIKHDGFTRRVLESQIKMKYNDICKKYLPEYKLNINRDITKEEIIDEIFKVHNIIGKTPTFKELKDYGVSYGFETICKVLNTKTYNDAILSLGLIPSGSTTLMKTEEEMLDDFYNYFKELKRVPYVDDLNENKNTVSSTTYIKYFGSILNVCKILNIDYTLFHTGNGLGRNCFDKNGDLCKSLVEKDITNYFIDNSIEYEKEYKYNNIIKNDTRIFDWKIKIDSVYYYIEYFGMFSRKPKGITEKYANKVKKKIKTLYKNNLIDRCIFIFPDDIKNKSFDEFFKQYFQLNKKIA